MGKFNLSNGHLTTMDMGFLCPVGWTLVVPGQRQDHAVSALVRCNPLNHPIYSRCDFYLDTWYYPFRCMWDNFQNFITGGPDGMDASVFPTMKHNVTKGSLLNRLQVPVGSWNAGAGTPYSAMMARMYADTYNTRYRDQDYMAELVSSKADGNDTTTNIALQRVAWEKDRFTSARLTTQKGPDIFLPLGTSAPVVFPTPVQGGEIAGSTSSTPQVYLRDSGVGGVNNMTDGGGGGVAVPEAVKVRMDAITDAFADLSTATAVQINALREALAMQRYEENNMNFGSRYEEVMFHRYGQRIPDARIQRPELLSRSRNTLRFSEVLQTGVTDDGDPLAGVGGMAGHGLSGLRSNAYHRNFPEFGIVLTLAYCRPRTLYFQGFKRAMLYTTKEDFFQPELQAIGQQEILNKEIFADGSGADVATYGFQPPYDEMRHEESFVSGEFGDPAATNYIDWHMGRAFTVLPELDVDVIPCDATKRVFQSTSDPGLLVQVNHKRKSVIPQLSQEGNNSIS